MIIIDHREDDTRTSSWGVVWGGGVLGACRRLCSPQATALNTDGKHLSCSSPERDGDSAACSFKEVSSQSSTRTHAARTHTRREVRDLYIRNLPPEAGRIGSPPPNGGPPGGKG